jgi:hypothetical protein
MKITLKRAHDLSRAVLKASKKLAIAPTRSISVYSEDVAAAINHGQAEFHANWSDFERLTNAFYAIRELINGANQSSGLHAKETQRKLIDAKLAKLNSLTLGAPVSVREVGLRMQNARARNESADVYSVTDTMEVLVLDENAKSMIEEHISALERERADLTDEIAAINFKTKITLDPDTLACLEAAKLV